VGREVEAELLLYDAGKKASYRMRLPAGGLGESCDRRTTFGQKQSKYLIVLCCAAAG
jgi:hypothetical protein